MDMQDQDDGLAFRIDAMRPGWRGRMLIHYSDEPDSDMTVTGTIVGEPSIERMQDHATDATITLCINYHAGHFGPVSKHSCIALRASQIVDMQSM